MYDRCVEDCRGSLSAWTGVILENASSRFDSFMEGPADSRSQVRNCTYSDSGIPPPSNQSAGSMRLGERRQLAKWKVKLLNGL